MAEVRAERDALKLQLSASQERHKQDVISLQSELDHWKDCHGATADKLEESNRLNGEYRKALRNIFDRGCTCHRERCIYGFSVVEEALAEKRKHEHRFNTIESNPKNCLDCGERVD